MTSTATIVQNIRHDQLGAAKVRIFRTLEEKLREALFLEYQTMNQTVLTQEGFYPPTTDHRANAWLAGNLAGERDADIPHREYDQSERFTRWQKTPGSKTESPETSFRRGYRSGTAPSGYRGGHEPRWPAPEGILPPAKGDEAEAIRKWYQDRTRTPPTKHLRWNKDELGNTTLADENLREKAFRAGYQAGTQHDGNAPIHEAYQSPEMEQAFREGYRAAERNIGGLVDVNAENGAVQEWHQKYSLTKPNAVPPTQGNAGKILPFVRKEDIKPAASSNKLAGRKVLVEPEDDLPIDEVGLGF